jgi:NO-binding membrane sensor protein with MHYT domain
MTQYAHFLLNIDFNNALLGEFNTYLVLLSYFVAVLAGFCAFNLIRFVQLNQSIRLPILISGGITLGLSIWSMHFTGMLAFSLPIPVLYDPTITLFSVFPAILASMIFFE